MEELKPNDFFEREIKDEPLDEEHFKLNHSQFEEVVEPCQQSNSHFFNRSSGDISNSSSQIFKQEPVCSEPISAVAMNDIKMESIDDFQDNLNSQRYLNHKFMEKLNQRVYYNHRCSGEDFYYNNTQPFGEISNGESSSSSSQIIAQNIKEEQKFIPFHSESISGSEINDVKLEPIDVVDDKQEEDYDFVSERKTSKKNTAIKTSQLLLAINSSSRQNNCLCAVCFKFKNGKFVKYVTSVNDKLVIMIGCVLRGEFTIEKAQSFKSRYQRIICYTHYSEAFNAICNALHIQSPYDIFTCSLSLIQNLMSTVNSLRPQLSALMFHKILREVVVRNKSFIEMPVMNIKLGENVPKDLNVCNIKHLISKKNLSEARYYCRCSVCSRKEIRKNMKDTSIENEKLIIMVGRSLRGDSTFEEAQSFIPSKRNCFICHVHFSDAIKEICNALHIQHPNDICSCSVDLMRKLMITVNAICPQLSALDFQVKLKQFVLKNKGFIQLASLSMQVDEQTPIDISENETKEKPEDFIEKAKEEPLKEQTVPNYTQFVDPYLPATSSSSTQNMYFPQQSQNFGQYITEVQSFATELSHNTNFPPSRLGMEVKQEAEEFLKKVKKEPLEDQYFGQTVPKLEEFVDPCLPSNSSLPTQNFEQNVKQKDFVIEPQNVSPIVCRIPTLEKDSESEQRLTESRNSSGSSIMALKARCAVCSQVESTSKLKLLGRYDERLIIMLGRVLRRQHTLLDAHLFLSENRRKDYIFICHAHFSEIFNEIYKVLHINNCHEIEMCSLDLIQILMPTVNFLNSKATPLQLRTLLRNVAMRYEQSLDTKLPFRLEMEKQKPENSAIARYTAPSDFRKRHCSVCSLLRNDESLKFLAVEDDKLMIMIGCILREEYTLERAKSFMSMRDLFSCRCHYSETLDEICKTLNIRNHNRISMSSSELMESLMKIVNALRPKFTVQKFRMCFRSFAARNEHFEN